MHLYLICLGKTADNFISDSMASYEKKLPRPIRYKRIEIATPKYSKGLAVSEIQKKEMELLQAYLNNGNKTILLDENGKEKSSVDFSKMLNQEMEQGTKGLQFIIGGAYGFHPDIINANFPSLSLSKMTFTHQMVRLIFAEQLYRAFSILQNKGYHHE